MAAGGVAGVRGDRRGRYRGDILGNCSYPRAGGRGRDGDGVFGGVPRQLTIVSRVLVVYHHYRPYESQCFVFC